MKLGSGRPRRRFHAARHAAAGSPDPPLPPARIPAPPLRRAPRRRRRRRSVELAVVKSPIVGTFYRSPEPGAASFVEIGQRVKKDQVLCIIEAMKLMNEITSEYDGEIVSVYVENGKPVQYGERLFAIRTDAGTDVQENPDRQPRRNRAARDLRLPRARDQDRRGLFGGRRELAARPLRRRGRLHRPGAQRRQLPERAGGASAPPRSPAPTRSIPATGSCRRAPTSPKSARPATSSSSGPRRTSSACSATRRARAAR